MISFTTRVLNGFPVEIEAQIECSDVDAGIRYEFAGDIRFLSVRTGKPLGRWIEKRIDASPGEWDKINDEISQHAWGY